jgi:hypothetical protein
MKKHLPASPLLHGLNGFPVGQKQHDRTAQDGGETAETVGSKFHNDHGLHGAGRFVSTAWLSDFPASQCPWESGANRYVFSQRSADLQHKAVAELASPTGMDMQPRMVEHLQTK